MKKFLCAVAASLVSAVLAGCGSMNSVLADRLETVEHYHIFDIKTTSNPDVVIKSIADGLARNTNSVVQNRPLQIGVKVPDTPDRFTLRNPIEALKGTGMGGFLSMAGGAGTSIPKVAMCDTAVWTAKANRQIAGYENLNLYACLYRYRAGYELDVYATFQKKSGGLSGLARDAASAMVGTPEQWVNKVIVDMTRSIEGATNTKVTYVEGQPELTDLPKADQFTQR